MADVSRLEDLRRRVENDPASIAFAQPAEECRRGGDLEEAVRICRAGLEHHPAFLSARGTLGRALMELGRGGEAQAEFQQVLVAAPDNPIALRSVSDIQQARSEHGDAPAPAVVSEVTDPALEHLERWLVTILADRTSRAAS